MFTCRDLMVNVFPGSGGEPVLYLMTCQASPAPRPDPDKNKPKPPKPPRPNCPVASAKPPRGQARAASDLDRLRADLRQSL